MDRKAIRRQHIMHEKINRTRGRFFWMFFSLHFLYFESWAFCLKIMANPPMLQGTMLSPSHIRCCMGGSWNYKNWSPVWFFMEQLKSSSSSFPSYFQLLHGEPYRGSVLVIVPDHPLLCTIGFPSAAYPSPTACPLPPQCCQLPSSPSSCCRQTGESSGGRVGKWPVIMSFTSPYLFWIETVSDQQSLSVCNHNWSIVNYAYFYEWTGRLCRALPVHSLRAAKAAERNWWMGFLRLFTYRVLTIMSKCESFLQNPLNYPFNTVYQ